MADNSDPPRLPANKQFKILTSTPSIIFTPNNHEEFDKKMKEFQNLPLHELLAIAKKGE